MIYVLRVFGVTVLELRTIADELDELADEEDAATVVSDVNLVQFGRPDDAED